ncbi:hypothetical protein SAMN05877809_1077 [Rhodobacter sp. JA431]|uniref:hypothetical protein n=1 Tax=Rhodobacter sp. JA431 TaxID=570013 RepID=UPI000BCC9A00|nr:hypothetical protein [Rhodobacter sp. JA431]SOC13740.1 hypothetical protein SAMN05877809_1077 [Rhodobacter sp. JA431]
MSRRGEGEASFTFKGAAYRLVIDFNALADFEDQIGENAFARLDRSSEVPLTAVEQRAFLWAALRDQHPQIDLRGAGKMVKAGRLAFRAALASFLAEPETGEEEEGEEQSGGGK